MDILEKFNRNELEVMNSIKNLCIKMGIKAYIVGGAIRDAVLDNKIKDIDICVDVNPDSIAKSMDGLKYYKYYERFQTATLTFNNGINIDLIRCRREYYNKNGELPIVEPSDIYHDLYRRDFTINSLAYDMIENNILDIFGGISDIKNKIVRKIHLDSYREDPTRIFRAIKYCVRYGFYLKDEAEIKNCIHEHVINTISNDRIIKEIYLLCCEANWVKNMYLCGELKIFNISGQVMRDGYCICEKKLISRDKYKNIDIRILSLFYCLKDEIYVNMLIENSVLNKKLKNTIKYFSTRLQEILDLMKGTLDNYKLYNLLKDMSDYDLTFLSWYNELNYKVYNYINNMSNYKINLNGNDIKNTGVKQGKSIKKILDYISKIELNTALKWEKEYLLKTIGEIYRCL